VLPFRCGPPGSDFPRWPASGYPGSLAGGLHACVRSRTTQGQAGTRHNVPSHVAFRLSPQRRHPGPSTFRGSILCPHVPLSTLRRRPHGRQRMTRGRCDRLNLQRTELSSATICRFSRRTEAFGSQSHSLRQPAYDQHSLRAPRRQGKPNNGGLSRSNLRTVMIVSRPNARSLWPIFSKPQDFADLVRIS